MLCTRALSLLVSLCHMYWWLSQLILCCVTSGHIWCSILILVAVEVCTELHFQAPQWACERGHMDGQRIVLFNILSHSSWLIFYVKDNTCGVLLYQRDAYFDVIKIFFLCVMKIAICKIYKNKLVQSKCYFHFFRFIILKLCWNISNLRGKVNHLKNTRIFPPCRFNKC